MGDFLQADGRRIHYVETGVRNGPALVLLHGQSGTWYDWSYVIPALARKYRVVAIDHPGFGDSDWDASGKLYQVGGFSALLPVVLRQLSLERFVMIGHSFGGRISLAYACSHPEQVRAVVLADSAPDIDPQGSLNARKYLSSIPAQFPTFEEAAPFFQSHYPNLTAGQMDERLRNYMRQLPSGAWQVKRDPLIGETYKKILAGQGKAPPPDWTSLRDCPCPVLLLRGSESDLVTPAIERQMREAQPRMETIEISNAGHLVCTEQPGQVTDALLAYLDKLAA